MDHSKHMEALREEFPDIGMIRPTGSSYTCEPPVEDTDIDFIAYVPNLSEFRPVAEDLGWLCSSPREDTNTAYPVVQCDCCNHEEEPESPSIGSLLHDINTAVQQVDTYPKTGDFLSFRYDNLNLIVTDSTDYYDKYVLATELAKRFNLLNKKDRCDLFEAILYGELKDE